ncbi:hypothetical protein WA026_007131 [Henosepilachna vigintioctopunctata]|uniref:Uncharacterized protein n=1 Tax=Henosepilachna vigintioctopunctata TaxID=420089 RepID=A0AAW1V9E3_9CUCU
MLRLIGSLEHSVRSPIVVALTFSSATHFPKHKRATVTLHIQSFVGRDQLSRVRSDLQSLPSKLLIKCLTKVYNKGTSGLLFFADKADLVSRELVQLAKCNGSSDNISVIVVFLRHPRIIAAGPRWTDIVVGMEAIDNANDPFVVQNKANGDGGLNDHDNVVDGLLLNNINDDFDVLKKKDDMPNNDLMKMLEKSNLARLTPEFDKDDNLGPETDVDNPDGGSLSPNVDAMTLKSEAINNNQQYNPFNDIEKSLELNLNLKEGTFKGMTSPEEETCPTQTNSENQKTQKSEVAFHDTTERKLPNAEW